MILRRVSEWESLGKRRTVGISRKEIGGEGSGDLLRLLEEDLALAAG
ncbi:hypothetical protein [Tunturiibacter gelidoferens]|uniref:Uncharacterized protein n=1 Tax=Tunturiibacter gelidiferens TaxID=3069689 RepID=A0ACC5P436_9BACT|nr:hypothetical protein [Edaphobacter lichenicola]MBB5341480.1 hypothetical protein [Edaphobacter lichenicola]